MTDPTQGEKSAQLSSLQQQIVNIAKNKVLSALVVPLDNFLTTVQTNQAGLVGIAGAADVLKAQALAALPQAGVGTLQDAAGVIKQHIDADVKKAEAGNDTTGSAGEETTAGAGNDSTAG